MSPTPPKDPKMSGRIAMIALALMFALVVLMICLLYTSDAADD